MIFEQVLHRDLGCASYFLADGGEAIVVDARFDIDVYVELAERSGARIVHVLDSHDHADHVSGRGRLARRCGAASHRAARAADSEPGDLRPGDELRVGAVVLRAIATPGHRPEHLSFAVADTERSEEPCLLLSGDSLLIGDVARPDLAVEPREGATELHASLRELLELGDHVELWPAHVGGSLCGGAGLKPKTSSTVGVERRCVPALTMGQEQFVDTVGTVVAPKPPSVARIVALNRSALASEPDAVELVKATAAAKLAAGGATVLDVRPSADFDAGHLADALSLPTGGQGLGTRAGWALAVDEPVVVVARDSEQARHATSLLHAAGIWSVRGTSVADPEAWRAAGSAVRKTESIDIESLAAALLSHELALVDVRADDEWDAGHVEGSVHMSLAELRDGRGLSLPEPPRGRFAVACKGGGRAALGASLLRRGGLGEVLRVTGGGIPDLPEHGVDLS